MRRHQGGQLSESFRFIPTPGQTGDLPPVNVDNSNLMAAAVGEVTSSSSSKLPVKRPYHKIKQFNEDDPIPQVLPVAAQLVQQGLPESNIIGKHKKSKKDIDSDSYEKRKALMANLKIDVERLTMDKVKLEVLMEVSKAQNVELLAALESSKIALAEMEKNMAQIKISEDIRKQTVARLHKLIEEDVSCNIDKEELWAQFYNQDGKQTFEKYWEKNKKYKHEFRAIVEMLLLLP